MTDQKALDGALLKGAQTIEEAQGQIQSELSSLQSKLAGIGSSWQGEAASAFQSVMTQWDAEARKVTEALTELHSAMRASDTKSKANEAEQAAVMNKFQSMLGA